jgi:hypothetical protein
MWQQNWGDMIWGGVAAVPAINSMALLALGAALGLIGRFMIKKGGFARLSALLGLALLVISVPLTVRALSLPHIFSNGTVADAGQVNANFSSLAVAIDQDRARLGSLENAPGRVYVGTVTVFGSAISLGSYAGADRRCQDVFPGSFVCTTQEVFESHRQGLLPSSGGIAINSGLAGIDPPNVADCRGWSGEGYRTGVNFTSGPTFVTTQNGCAISLSFPLGCCR